MPIPDILQTEGAESANKFFNAPRDVIELNHQARELANEEVAEPETVVQERHTGDDEVVMHA